MRYLLMMLLVTALGAEEHHHAAHGGILNEIGSCENGHAEVVIEGPRLRLWFVGGGNQTGTAVRVADRQVVLTDSAGHTLTLQPTPLTLAEETVGDCSAFAGEAPWLAGMTKGRLSGPVTFKGKAVTLMITWPDGFEADEPSK